MRFFQVLTTNRFKSTLDRQYVYIQNYASLAKALEALRVHEYKQPDGTTFNEPITGEELVQYHLMYEEGGCAVIELRHEYFGYPKDCTTYQVVEQEAVYVKEINLKEK